MTQNYIETALSKWISKSAKPIFFLLSLILSINSQASTYTVTSGISWSNLRTLVTPNADPTASDVVSLSGAYTLTVDVSNAACLSITIRNLGIISFNSGSQLTLNGGTGIFTLGASGNAHQGTLDMTNGGVLNCGNITNGHSSNVVLGNGEVNITNSGTNTLSMTSFPSLKISGSGTVNLSDHITVNGDLTINSSCTLSNQMAYNITLIGNWINNGTFYQNNSTTLVYFAGTSTQNISGSTVTTFNMPYITNTSAPVTTTSSISILGIMDVGANAVFSPGASTTISGVGEIRGSGTIRVSRTGNDAFPNQYTLSTKTLTSLTVEFVGTSAQSILTPYSFSNLTINTAAGVSLSNNLTVSNNLSLTGGSFTLGGNNLTLGATATITNAASTRYIVTNNNSATGGFLIQRVIGANKVFPVGTSTYTPVTLNNSGTAEDFRVRVFNGVYGNGTTGSLLSRGVNRTWLVEKVGAAGVSITMTLQWNDVDEDASFTRGNCAVFHYTVGSWDDPSSFASAGGLNPYTVSRSGITTFSPFGVGDNIEPLPVELISFEANRSDKNNSEIKLEWVTAAEINNSHFAIERSADGKSFETIDIVEGAGNSNSLLNYSYFDMDPLQQNISYYRLKQVDFDGTSSYSSVQVIKAVTAFLTIGDAYPMPAQEIVNIPMQSVAIGNWVVDIHRLSGGLVSSETLSLTAGLQTLSFPTSELPQGLYILSIKNGSETHSMKLIK